MSLERKLRRKKAHKAKKNAEKELATKVALLGKLPNSATFVKLNREQVMSWNVVVRQQEEKVHLYCPECWDNAQKIVKKYTEDKNGVLPTK